MTIQRNFGTSGTVLAAGTAGTTQIFGSNIDHKTSGYVASQILIQAAFPNPATDDLDFWIYSNLTGTYTGTEVAVTAGRIAKTSGQTKTYPLILPDFLHARPGFKSSGTTDPITVTCAYEAWNFGTS